MKTSRFFCFFLFLLCLHDFGTLAQAPAWEKAIGVTLTDSIPYISNINTDTTGNAYVLSSQKSISKFSSKGALLWTKKIPAESFSKDAAGNVYLTGILNQNLIIDKITLTCSPTKIAAFIIKLDPAGNVVWANQSQPKDRIAPNNMPSLYVSKISTDSAGNSLIVGYSFGAVSFDSVLFAPTAPNPATYFIVKYDTTGTVSWVNERPPSYITEIVFAPQNTYYILDSWNIFKYSDNGLLLWEKTLTTSSNSLAQFEALVVDEEGNCFITGTTDMDIPIDNVLLKSTGHINCFLVKYSSSGNILWATINKNLSDLSQCNATALAYKNGQLYLTGSFTGTTTFDKRLPNLITPLQQSQVFVAKFSSNNGMPYWAQQTISAAFAYGTALACLASGEVFTAGYYHPSGCTFGTITLQNNQIGKQHSFVAKLGVSTALPLEPVTEPNINPEPPTSCQFCPNPAQEEVNLNFPAFGNGNLQVYNTTGKQIYTTQLPANGKLKVRTGNWAGGLYFLRISGNGNAVTHKLVVAH